jgi:Uma2 family endonuclease
MEAMDEASLPPAQPVTGESRILLRRVAWSTYVMLRDEPADMHLRMTYLQGALEIMSPGRRHEVSSKLIARLLELFCLERNIPLYGYRSETYRKKRKKRGLEPDECYARDHDKVTPDVAIEVIVTSPLLDKLEVYRGLGILEVWVFQAGAFTIHRLRGDRHVTIAASEVFPEVDLARLAHYAAQPDQHAALVAFRAELRR